MKGAAPDEPDAELIGSPQGGYMILYRLFSHDGLGNFSLLHEFKAKDDAAAARLVVHWRPRSMELWQSSRRVTQWA